MSEAGGIRRGSILGSQFIRALLYMLKFKL